MEIPKGLCECGCGGKTKISNRTDSSIGWLKGKPIRFIRGHQRRGTGKPPAERFWKKVRKTEECWLWEGATNNHGYGILRVSGKAIYAHRFSYELHKGKIPRGLTLDHLCRTPACVRPAHLEAVTHRENCLRGMSPNAINARKTHCKHGHEFTVENTIWRKDGKGRNCKTCKNKRDMAYYYRKLNRDVPPITKKYKYSRGGNWEGTGV